MTGSWKPPWSCTHTPCRTHIFLTHFPCVAYRHRVHAWLKVFAVRHISPSHPLHPHVSSAFFAVPARSLRDHIPVCTVFAELFPIRQRGSSTPPHERRGADSTHSTGCETKEFDKISCADGDTTPINDPNYDNTSDFSKITRENTGLFGVSTMLEASVSHVSHGESKDSMHRETVA